ncbi:hypothetical protein EUZ87_14185 [Lactiplantibacillus paraplantarum]|uniref:Uncharacterized protein n=1 Tax=Lactiplantibacillus paraplantarum TaxID=60520 RepID=A0A4Q9XYI4_9LACO|nr:hypothetical protein EUZ87_14185 [Lactiplantibacillus paraplantarum]
MELTIGLIIGTSIILALLCGILSVYYYRYAKKLSSMIWGLIGVALLCLAGFFIWVVWFGL